MSKRPTKPRPARRPAPTFAAGPSSAGNSSSAGTPSFAAAADRPRFDADAPRGRWLTGLAVGLAVVVVVARLLMSEAIRPVGTVSPGSPEVPGGPGPAVGLLLDLLAGLCPLLVLARRWFDPTFALRRAWSPLLFWGLGTWAALSTVWASDRFAAVVSASHLLAAGGVLWAVAQASRDWQSLWRAAAVSAGLLAVLLTHGVWYHLVDRQDLIDQFNRDPSFLAKVQNVQPGTFAYTQLQNSVLHGELRGFSVSANTYGALLVLLGLVTLGGLLEAARQGRWGAAAVAGVLLVADGLVLPLAQSRTAALTGTLGAATVVAVFALSTWRRTAGGFSSLLRRRAGALYFVGLTGVFGVAAFVVGYGVSRGTLFHDSLNFRWRYWTASADLVRHHPWLGVGWENFGSAYLGVRTPEATEEIKDPHDFLVRFAAELGLLAGLLALAWTARTWWELTRPVDPAGGGDGGLSESTPDGRPAAPAGRAAPLPMLLGLAVPLVVGVVVNAFASVDLSAGGAFVGIEVVRRCAFALALLAGAVPVALRLVRLDDPGEPVTDRPQDGGGDRQPGREQAASAGGGAAKLLGYRPGPVGPRASAAELTLAAATAAAPLLRAGLLVGLGMFFVHNLVDFAMFEVGPTFLFALLLGVAVGTRTRPAEAAEGAVADTPVTPAGTPSPPAGGTGTSRLLALRGRRYTRVAVAILGAVWLLAAALLVGPVVAAEAVAGRADDALRRNQARSAALGYEAAFGETVRNADYAARAARAWQWAGDPARAKAAADLAVAANPADPTGYADRADLLAALQPPDLTGAAADLDRAVALDPMNRAVRLRYAAVLEQAGRPRAALQQCVAALDLNERLAVEEKKRLTPAQVCQTLQSIARLAGAVYGP